jgi:REP element-mobilizing transposase RayT
MRSARIVDKESAYYHIVSRVVDRQMVFDENEKERFRKTMRAVAEFSGIRIMTYAAMTNHWHILTYVPEREEVSDGELVRRLSYIYRGEKVERIAGEIKVLRSVGNHVVADRLKQRYTYRMYDLGEFMKTLKQRVTMSYNRRHHRTGTLWEARFKSVLIEGSPSSLIKVASYIDLNPVRAGMVSDPKDYRFSGYGEAMGGSKQARAGLMSIMRDGIDHENWKAACARYRQLLYVRGEERGVRENGEPVKAGFSEAVVAAVVDVKGKLPLNERLRSRIRYFTDGAIIGSRIFVEDAFGRHRGQFSEKREEGARPMKGANWGDMFTARQLRVELFGMPVPV